jgi:hypothetical protein
MSTEEIAEIHRALESDGEYHGGGALAEFTIKLRSLAG